MKRVFSILFLSVLLFSCKKDDEIVTGPDLFVGSYTGTNTTILDENGVWIEFSEAPITKTIEKGSGTNDLIIGKGTDLEFNASIDGQIFLIPGHQKHFITGTGIDISFSITGQGLWNNKNELNITYSGYTKIDKTEYKITIAETLKRIGK